MERTQLQQSLRDGIAAVRRGDLAQGQALLLQVVEADERNEAAWLWLAEAVTDPRDQLVALENVLTLNPNQQQAREKVSALKKQLGLPPTPPPQPALRANLEAPTPNANVEPVQPMEKERPSMLPRDFASRAAPAPAPPVSVRAQFTQTTPDEDPNLCVYCGRLTPPEATKCPHCRKNLMTVGRWRDGYQQWALLMLAGLNLQAAFMQMGAAYAGTLPETARFWVLIPAFFLNTPLWALVVHTFLWAMVIWLSLSDLYYAYPVGAVAAAFEVIGIGIGFQLGLFTKEVALINGIAAAFLLLICLEANLSRFFASRRMRLTLDRNVAGAMMLQVAGRQHMRAGKWALAELHYRKAVARNPKDPALYQDLAQAQYRLKRYEQAIQTLRSALELAPANAGLKALLTKITATQHKRDKP